MADKDQVDSTDDAASAELPEETDRSDAQNGDAADDTGELEPIDEGRDVRDREADEANQDGSDKVLEPAGVGATTAGSASATPTTRRRARTPKGVATSKRDQPAAKPERTGPVKFVRQSVGELRKVVYPTGQQLINYFVVVLVFVLFVIAYVSLLDLGLGKAVFALFS